MSTQTTTDSVSEIVLAEAHSLRGRIVPYSWETIKRLTDVVLSSTVLTLSFPIILTAMLAVCLTSPGSPIFRQQRVGRNGRTFMIYKLRTMAANAHRDDVQHLADEAVLGPTLKIKADPRVFPIGRFLRKTSIDELPNLVNVLRGEMSVVGPRPSPAAEHAHCKERYEGSVWRRRLSVKPGITGLWQVSGRSNLSALDDRVKLDVEYASSWTPLGDVRILLATIPAVLFGRGAY